MTLSKSVVIFSVLGILAACSSGSPGPTGPGPVTVVGYSVAVKGAPPTSAQVSTTVPIGFTVTEHESDGSSKPANGKALTVAIVTGGGTVGGGASLILTTGGDGSAGTTWVLGPLAGSQMVRGSVSATEFSDVGIIATAPPPPPVTSVTFFGAQRVKVGDTYTYTLVQLNARGDTVSHAVTWRVLVPATANLVQPGAITILQNGTITLIARIDGQDWAAELTGYEWLNSSSSNGVIASALAADVPITNFLGTAEYPTLLVGCSSGTYVVGVAFTGIVTQDGNVAYEGDNQVIVTETWLEVPPQYNLLAYPGTTNLAQKNFARGLATNHLFGLAFGEYLHGTHATLWRLTGMSSFIAQGLAACASDATIQPSPEATGGPVARIMAAFHAIVPNPRIDNVRAARSQDAGSMTATMPVPSLFTAPLSIPGRRRQ